MNNPYDQLADAWDEGYAVGHREGNAQGESYGYELGYKQGRDDTRKESTMDRAGVIEYLQNVSCMFAEKNDRYSVMCNNAIREAATILMNLTSLDD